MKQLYIIFMICTAWLPLKAQVNVSIQILPPYPTKITDYASHPQLMLISVTNTSATTQKVQLRGAVTGDNGVELRVRNNYKSVAPIMLNPGQTQMLNGAQLKYFFDYTRIDYKGITQNQFINNNGLPEGSYRFCIRAYDYDTNAPISADEPVGCSNTFTVSSLEPPTIISPREAENVSSRNGQSGLILQWSTPPGTSPQIMSGVRYHVRMVEIRDNRNPNNAIVSSTQPPFFDKDNVMGNIYVFQPFDPQLTPGMKYAMIVQATDPINGTPFRNAGRSEVRVFTYTKDGQIIPEMPAGTTAQKPIIGPVPNNLVCDCAVTKPTGTSANAQVKVNSQIKVGAFNMQVTQVTASANNAPVNGEGVIGLPFIGNTPGAKLRVKFTGLDVTQDLKMKDGTVEGNLTQGAPSFIPTLDNPNPPDMQLTPQQATQLESFFTSHANQMIDAVKQSGNSAGFDLPLGISKGPVTIAITRVHFRATQAWFEAAGSMEIPDGDADNILGLVGKNMCISDAENFCKEGQLFLGNDFDIGNLHLKLLGGQINGADTATMVSFNKSGFVKLHIKANYTFPQGTLIDVNNNPLTATLTGNSLPGTSNGWSDWVASVMMPQFYITGLKSISFDLKGQKMYYDHSDFQRPPAMPASFTSSYPGDQPINTAGNLWRGFYIPSLTVNLPGIIKKANQNISTAVTNLIIDEINGGITGNVTASNILTLETGSLGGWHASVDAINLKFFRSAFRESTMDGKLILPATSSANRSKQNNQISYQATLNTPADNSGNLAYEFKMFPTNGAIDFDALFMHVTLDGATSLVVSGTDAKLRGEMNLTGELSLAADPKTGVKIPGLGKVTLPRVRFYNLVLQTDGDFINTKNFHADLTSSAENGNGGGSPGNSGFDYIPPSGFHDGRFTGGPSVPDDYATSDRANADGLGGFSTQQKLAGFDFSLASSGLYLAGDSINISFTGGVTLAKTPIACEANGKFTLTSQIGMGSDGYISWKPRGGRVDQITLGVDATLGPLGIKGAMRYYNDVSTDNEGIIAALETNVGQMFSVNMRAQFGNMADGQNSSFNYFQFSALVDFGETGITFAPPIPIAFYGFGGGICYNMSMVSSLPSAQNVPHKDKKSDTSDVPATSGEPLGSIDDMLAHDPSGLSFKPDKGKFGLQATVLLGLTSRNTLDADATLAINIDTEHGTLTMIDFQGNARVLTDISKPLPDARKAASTGAGALHINMNTVDHTFDADLRINLGLPTITHHELLSMTGGGSFHYHDADDWYIKIGTPRGTYPGPNTLTVLGLITGQSYFEVGTNVDQMPEIDPDVLAQINGGHDKKSNQADKLVKTPAGNRHYDVDNGSGLIMGGTVQLGDTKEHQFLMFYGTLFAKMGFDISIIKDGAACDNFPNKPGGPGGWYARGQAYFGAQASIGIKVNLFVFKGKFTIFDAGAAAIVQAGLPNPAWVEGTIGGHFSILDGAIASDFSFNFSMGEKCVNSNADAFGGLEMISQITPPDASDKKQPVNTEPSVIFNIKNAGTYGSSDHQMINSYFEFDDYVHSDKYGEPRRRFFKFDKSCLAITLNGQNVIDEMERLDKDGYALGYNGGYLTKNTSYTFKVVAKLHEGYQYFPNGFLNPSAIAFDENKFVLDSATMQPAFQQKSTTFTTDNGFGAIPASEYAMTGPMHSHKSIPVGQATAVTGKVFLDTKGVIDNNNFFQYPSGTQYFARIYRNGVQDGGDISLNMGTASNNLTEPYRNAHGNLVMPLQGQHTRWSFPQPQLHKSSNYVVLMIAKTPSDNSSNGRGVTDSVQKSIAISPNNKSNMMMNNAVDMVNINVMTHLLSNHVNILKSNEHIVGGFNFRTSAYDTYDEKMSSLQIAAIRNTSNNATIKPGNGKIVNKLIFEHMVPRDNHNMYNIKIGSLLGGFNFPVEVSFNGESFSKADLDGTNSDELFQPSYNAQTQNPNKLYIGSLYGGPAKVNYGVNNSKLIAFIAANTGIPAANITVTDVPSRSAADNGIVYCFNTGGQDDEFTDHISTVDAPIPDKLPQQSNGINSMQIGGTALGGSIPGLLPYTYLNPVIYSTISAVVYECQSRGAVIVTSEIQKQIDKLKNWAVNPGDNMSTPGNNMTNVSLGMSGINYWEGVSTATTGYMNGTLNQSQLQGAIQGAQRTASGMRQ